MFPSFSCRFFESKEGFLFWSAKAAAVCSGNQGKYWPGRHKGLFTRALIAANLWNLSTGFALFVGNYCKGF
jgi:hypothetical protein